MVSMKYQRIFVFITCLLASTSASSHPEEEAVESLLEANRIDTDTADNLEIPCEPTQFSNEFPDDSWQEEQEDPLKVLHQAFSFDNQPENVSNYYDDNDNDIFDEDEDDFNDLYFDDSDFDDDNENPDKNVDPNFFFPPDGASTTRNSDNFAQFADISSRLEQN